MAEAPVPELNPSQVRTLEKLLRAGFRLATFERYGRYLGVEKDGFVALLDPGHGRLKIFSQAGYRIGDGIGMLVERAAGKAFVCHGESVPATPELLDAYEQFKTEVRELLEPQE